MILTFSGMCLWPSAKGWNFLWLRKRFEAKQNKNRSQLWSEAANVFLYFFGIWRQQPIRMFELVVNFWLLRRIFVSRSRATFGWGTIRNSEWERFFGKFPGKTQILKFSRCSAKFSLTLHSHEAPYSFFLLSVCPSFSRFLPYYVSLSLPLSPPYSTHPSFFIFLSLLFRTCLTIFLPTLLSMFLSVSLSV